MTLPVDECFLYVAERDIDLLLLEEAHVNSLFADWLADHFFGDLSLSRPRLIAGQHSCIDPNLGESDLVLTFEDQRKRRVCVLIENKIDAQFQPQQAERYRARAEIALQDTSLDTVRTGVIAPAGYLRAKPHQVALFDCSISYEDIENWLANQNDERSSYRARVIREAIHKKPRDPGEAILSFYNQYWEAIADRYPELVGTSEPRGPQSTWPFFQCLQGCNGIQLKHKTGQGYVDLEIASCTIDDLAELEPNLTETMSLEQTGKSSVVRLAVPPINMNAPFEDQADDMEQCLAAAQKLLIFYRNHKETITRVVA